MTMTIPFPLQEALKDSITSGTFVDTKFWLFSKRASKPGRVGDPKPLFVNGHVVRRVPRLASLLDDRGTKENLRARFPTDRRPYTTRYDYEDDSDLEEDDDDDDDDDDGDSLDDESAGVPQAVTEKLRDNDVVVLEKPNAKSNQSSDIISVSDLDSLFSESAETKGETEITSHVGKVVVIEDVAFVTFQAMLRYLYTDEIEFAPWGSTEGRKARALEKTSESYGIPKPSPKSVYRLADKYDIPELKQLALRQIQQDLSKCSITEEVFSEYTSWYPELRELELRQLARVLLSSNPGPTLWLLKAKVKSYGHGELSHAEHVLPALYELMESDESVEETPLPAAAPRNNQQATGGDWEGLKRALTSSLTSGTFLDSQFYAVESRSSTGLPKILPVYFCSTVAGSFTSMLVAHSSRIRARRAPPPRCADGYDSDIDDENPDPHSSPESYPCSRLVRENSTAADSPIESALLLKSGAAKTWGAVFLYAYTGRIAFANLSSQDVTPSEKGEAQDGSQRDGRSPQGPGRHSVPQPSAVVAEPCSPKSVYCLANKVGLIGLCNVALKDIQSKLDKDNIVHELFSPFTANHKRAGEMEYKLFRSKLKPSVDGTLVSSIIRSSSSGLSSHRGAVIELMIEGSIRERRERTFTRAKNSLRPDPTPQAKRTSETPNMPIPEVRLSTPAPAPQLPSQSLPNDANGIVTSLASASAKYNTSPDSPALPRRTNGIEIARGEESPADVKTNPSPSEDSVELACLSCGIRQLRGCLWNGVYCRPCPSWFGGVKMKCVGCDTIRTDDVGVCTSCHRTFK